MSVDVTIPRFLGRVVRLRNTPLVDANLFPPASVAGLEPEALANINGPSVLRMPDWASGRLGTFHMYFGHHKGKSIRLAYTDALQGPWKMHPDPIMPLSESLFEPVDPPHDPKLKAPDWVEALGGDYLYAHVASPDVHVDEGRRRLVMYYHGLLADGDQQTRLATSTDGLQFTPQEPLLGPPYFRATWLDGGDGPVMYLSMWEGRLGRARSWEGPFDLAPPDHLPPHVTGAASGGGKTSRDPKAKSQIRPPSQIRHGHVFAHKGRLHLTFSRIGDTPERLLHCEMVPADDWADWRFGPVSEMMRSAPGWEGGGLPIQTSVMGTAMDRLHELRDPALFTDDGKVYLAYCGGGEQGLGIALIEGM